MGPCDLFRKEEWLIEGNPKLRRPRAWWIEGLEAWRSLEVLGFGVCSVEELWGVLGPAGPWTRSLVLTANAKNARKLWRFFSLEPQNHVSALFLLSPPKAESTPFSGVTIFVLYKIDLIPTGLPKNAMKTYE